MIEITNLGYHYPGSGHRVFNDFDLTIEGNHIYGLLGKNGTGKSTLLYLINGLLRPTAGTVNVDGYRSFDRSPEMLEEMFLVPEEYDMPDVRLPEYAAVSRKFYPRFSDEILRNCLDEFEIAPDVNLKALFRRVVARNMTDDRTLIISTHQVHDIENLLDHIIIIDNSKVLLNAGIDDITRNYVFRSISEADSHSADVVYAEPNAMGQSAILRRHNDETETQINLELLFDAVTLNHLKL